MISFASSEGAVTEVVLDLGTGDAMVGRSVRKVIEGHKDSCKGHISRYIAAQRLYQVALISLRTLQPPPSLVLRNTLQY